MKATRWTSIMLASLLAATGCRDETDRAAQRVMKAQENVQEQRQDIARKSTDLAVQGEQLARAQRELSAARGAYQLAVEGRLASLDARIARLEQDTEPGAQASAARARQLRAELSTELPKLETQTEATWSDFSRDIERRLDDLERELEVALMTPQPP